MAVTAAIFLSSYNVSLADDYQKGVSAFEKGDHAIALSYWLPLADNGDPKAQYSLGKLYETGGQGESAQYKEAVKWYLKAAEQGIAAARNNLGRLFAQGKGVELDRTKAVEYWQLAAQSKHAMAQYNLGLAYFRGEGIEQNVEQAVFWFHQSANNGVGGAQYALGEVYRLGLSVPEDMVMAKQWYQKSALSGNKRAAIKVEEMGAKFVETPIEVDEQLPESQIESASADANNKNVDSVSDKVTEDQSTEADHVDLGEVAILKEVAVIKEGEASVRAQEVEKNTSALVTVPKPEKNPRRYAGIGTLLVSKPKPNPRR